MTAESIDPSAAKGNEEDYTGACCLLLHRGGSVLIDADLLDGLLSYQWHILDGRVIAPADTGRTRSCRPVKTMLIMHRFILDAPRHLDVDHRNHNTLDNRRSNLRLCTKSQNNMNRRPAKGKPTRYKGVYRCTNTTKWQVIARVRGEQHYLGTFADEVAAAKAYNDFVLARWGEFAYLNPV
jgi:hypothetical protein